MLQDDQNDNNSQDDDPNYNFENEVAPATNISLNLPTKEVKKPKAPARKPAAPKTKKEPVSRAKKEKPRASRSRPVQQQYMEEKIPSSRR